MSIAEAAIPTPYIHSSQKRRKNIWFSQKDGNWSDPNTWISNALSYCQFNFNYPGQAIPIPTFPQVGDDVYINHSVTFDFQANQTIYINNLYVSGTLKKAIAFNYTLVVNGDCQATGTIDLSGATGSFVLKLMGVNNYINTFTSGTTSTVYYARLGDQPIMNLSYRNLQIGGINTKTFTSDLTIPGNFTIDVSTVLNTLTCDISSYNLTVNGTTTVGSLLKKSGSGSLTFVGQLLLSNTSNNVIDFSGGNPTVECRGGISSTNQSGVDGKFNAGTGTWTFSTNNQTIDCRGVTALNFNGQVVISGAITITIDSTAYSGVGNTFVQFSNSCTGTSSSSKLLVKRDLFLAYKTSMPMASLGTFDFTTNSTSTIGFVVSSSFTIPYTTFNNLYIADGTNTLSGTTILNGNLMVVSNASSQLELSTFDFTVTGTTNLSNKLTKSGAGNVLFIGAMTLSNVAHTIDFSGGNPSIEIRGGITQINQGASNCNLGTGTLTFSTNNQTIASTGIGIVFTGSVLISGAITITLTGSIAVLSPVTFNSAVNGNNASSILDNRTTTAGTSYQSATAPMVTGKLYCNQATNLWLYNGTINQDIQPPSDPTNPGYSSLTLAGGAVVKKLLGNVSVKATYTLTSPTTLNSNGFSLTNP